MKLPQDTIGQVTLLLCALCWLLFLGLTVVEMLGRCRMGHVVPLALLTSVLFCITMDILTTGGQYNG